MTNYSNRFTVAVNHDEVHLLFYQDYPLQESGSGEIERKTEFLTGIVMSPSVAEELYEVLGPLLKGEAVKPD